LFDASYLAGVIGKEWDKKFPDLGSHFTFWSGDEEELDGVEVSFMIGATSGNQQIRNAVMASFPHKEAFWPRKDDQRVKDIVALMKKIWGVTEVVID